MGVKVVRITQEILQDICRGTQRNYWLRIADGLPSDAVCIDTCPVYDPFTNTVAFRFTHESFPEVKPGDEIPEHQLMVHSLRITPEEIATVESRRRF
jgi:hypothetical protein